MLHLKFGISNVYYFYYFKLELKIIYLMFDFQYYFKLFIILKNFLSEENFELKAM